MQQDLFLPGLRHRAVDNDRDAAVVAAEAECPGLADGVASRLDGRGEIVAAREFRTRGRDRERPAAGGAGDLTATINHGTNAVYDIVLLTQDMTAVTDLVWSPERPMEFLPGDELDIAWANANTRTYGLEIIYKGI